MLTSNLRVKDGHFPPKIRKKIIYNIFGLTTSTQFSTGVSKNHAVEIKEYPNWYMARSFIFLRFYLFTFREKGREGEREGEKHQCGRETWTGCLLHIANQACAPAQNRTCDHSFTFWDNTQPSERCRPGWNILVYRKL